MGGSNPLKELASHAFDAPFVAVNMRNGVHASELLQEGQVTACMALVHVEASGCTNVATIVGTFMQPDAPTCTKASPTAGSFVATLVSCCDSKA